MGQVDFGKIISAAAVSTLGVLSLIIVAVGGIAFCFFEGSPEKVKLSVWWTMLLAGGLFAAAVVGQSDSGKAPAPEPTPTPTPGPIDTPRPAASVTPTPTASQAVKLAPLQAAPAAGPESADLSGQWHDDGGYTYLITLSGSAIGIQQWFNGMAAGYDQRARPSLQLRHGGR